MRLTDGEERKCWLKQSFSFGKNFKLNQGDAPFLKRGTHTLNAAALLFAKCFLPPHSMPLSQLGTQGAALPRAAAPHVLPSTILPLPGYFLQKPLFAEQRGTQITQILLSYSFPEPQTLPRAQSSSPRRAGVAVAARGGCDSSRTWSLLPQSHTAP